MFRPKIDYVTLKRAFGRASFDVLSVLNTIFPSHRGSFWYILWIYHDLRQMERDQQLEEVHHNEFCIKSIHKT